MVDIAGGQGELSFELLNCLDVPSLVVEPQPALRLTRARNAMVRRNVYGRNPLYASYLDQAAYQRNRDAGGRMPDRATGQQYG